MVITDQQKKCVEDALSSPDALEQWLTENATRNVGYVRSATSCPIHNFLVAVCPDIFHIGVIRSSINLWGSYDYDDQSVYVDNPLWVRMFIDKVDHSRGGWIKGNTGLRYLREIKEEVNA